MNLLFKGGFSVGVSTKELLENGTSVATEEVLPERVVVKGPELKMGSNLNGQEKRVSSPMIKGRFFYWTRQESDPFN